MAQSTPSLNTKEMDVDNVSVQNVTVGTDGNPNVNPMLHRGASGELEIVRGDDTTLEGTRSSNKAQINVKNLAVGTDATLTNNVKLHRGGNGELGIVLADDGEAEGSRSNNHALLQAKSLVLGDSPNQSFNVKIKRAGNGLVQFVLGDDSYADGVFSPNYADVLGSIPIGSIISWNPGYFLDGVNGTFINADFLSVNTVAGANAYLNTRGYYVADGSSPGVTGTLIWNGIGRHLPNLTDDRFLMGTTICGGTGGSNDSSHDHSVTSNATASFDKSVLNTNQTAHTHNMAHVHAFAATSGSISYSWDDQDYSRTAVTAGVAPQHITKFTATAGGVINGAAVGTQHTYYTTGVTSGINGTGSSALTSSESIAWASSTAAVSVTNNAVTSGAASATENRPKYLGTFYIVRVF